MNKKLRGPKTEQIVGSLLFHFVMNKILIIYIATTKNTFFSVLMHKQFMLYKKAFFV